MTQTIALKVDVPKSRELSIRLPDDVRPGPAEMLITITSSGPQSASIATLGDLARSEFFGMWRERQDLSDPAAFARRLRQEGWSRKR
jgi:hypothetical protein